MLPQQVHHVLFIGLAAEVVETVDVNVHRPSSRGPFGRRELDFATALHPHMIRAYKLGKVFAKATALGDAATEALDHSAQGLLILDGAGRVRHLNRAAEQTLARCAGLSVRCGRLVGSSAAVTKAIDALILRAASPEPAIRTGGSMAVPAGPGRSPLSLSVTPLRAEPWAIFCAGPAVIVCVTDLEAEVELSEGRLRDVFGLTAAEARVARMLFRGATPAQVAQRSGVRLTTVRSQLASIFAKTDAAGQAELSRLMTRLTGGAAA